MIILSVVGCGTNIEKIDDFCKKEENLTIKNADISMNIKKLFGILKKKNDFFL